MLPDVIELPRAEDICRPGKRNRQQNKTAGQWFYFWFYDPLAGNKPFKDVDIAMNLFNEIIRAHSTTKAQIAHAIEQTVIKMGYEVEE